jgi:hypothetical protein
MHETAAAMPTGKCERDGLALSRRLPLLGASPFDVGLGCPATYRSACCAGDRAVGNMRQCGAGTTRSFSGHRVARSRKANLVRPYDAAAAAAPPTPITASGSRTGTRPRDHHPWPSSPWEVCRLPADR